MKVSRCEVAVQKLYSWHRPKQSMFPCYSTSPPVNQAIHGLRSSNCAGLHKRRFSENTSPNHHRLGCCIFIPSSSHHSRSNNGCDQVMTVSNPLVFSALMTQRYSIATHTVQDLPYYYETSIFDWHLQPISCLPAAFKLGYSVSCILNR